MSLVLSYTTNIRCKILCCYFPGWNALCCKQTYLAAILDVMITFRLSDYQMTIYPVLMDSLTPKTMVKTPNLQLYNEQWLIYCNFKAMAAILDAILKITPFWLPDGNLTGLNGFIDLQNHGVDTKITTLRQTMTDLLPFKCNGGHLGRHFENNTFPKVRFSKNFSMLFRTSNTTENRWKTFCSNLFGVGVLFVVNWPVYMLLSCC